MLRIKKLDIFVARQFGLLFVGTFFICQFVLMMQFLWRYVDDLIGKGLSMEVLAQFFWYMGLMLVPQALPLAILLSSLITFGNLGESSELTAIKSAGISLMQTFRSLIAISIIVAMGSFYFQNNVGPNANIKIAQLLVSMRQKSPELEIPEGVFYDGIPNSNLYVQKKDMDTGKLYGIMIYRMTGSYEDQAIILADSGMLQSTADKKHLVLTLWSGEWFENMQAQELAGSASVPYRRETFVSKEIVINYDGDFNMADAAGLSNKARGKSLIQLAHGRDSLVHLYDSIGRNILEEANRSFYDRPYVAKEDSARAVEKAMAKTYSIDSVFAKVTAEKKLQAVNNALNRVQSQSMELEFRSIVTTDGDKQIREHQIEAIRKFTLALSCIIFFFIGAPLGAIIRKGGLGVPVIISVLVFIIFYILDNTGYRMAQKGLWTIAFGQGLAPVVLIPFAAFVTYKANNDSVLFNADVLRDMLRRLLGLRLKRNIVGKEVIINDPDYAADAVRLKSISEKAKAYSAEHRLASAPNIVKVFFTYEPDHEIERISQELEQVVEDLGNTRDKLIISELNNYPVLSEKAHTRPFDHRWMNVAVAVLVPVGLVFYGRMWMFRLRLEHDLRIIRQVNNVVVKRIEDLLQADSADEQNGETR
ncbi:MAG: LptF/LptG family permease [Prevotella sp.]|nr:LptF/LptG family permease [Prevotella sp.]